MSKTTSSAVPAAPKADAPPLQPAFEGNKDAVAKQEPRAMPKDFKRSEVNEVRYTHYCAPETTPDDVSKPAYWAHVADTMMAMSHITVINRAHGWEMHLRVLQISNKLVKTAQLGLHHWGQTNVASAEIDKLKSQYRIEHRSDGWRVIDSSGNQLIAGLQSEQEAIKFRDQLLDSMAA